MLAAWRCTYGLHFPGTSVCSDYLPAKCTLGWRKGNGLKDVVQGVVNSLLIITSGTGISINFLA